MHVD
jgi:hypothetical protein